MATNTRRSIRSAWCRRCRSTTRRPYSNRWRFSSTSRRRIREPPLLPKDPRGRARVRGLSLIVACDGHPLIVPRIREYLEKEMHQDEAARNRWLQHWTLQALEALESHLVRERETGRFCHGDSPTFADICLAGQVFAAGYFNAEITAMPTVSRIFDTCMEIDAFDRSQPRKQPDAPKTPTH